MGKYLTATKINDLLSSTIDGDKKYRKYGILKEINGIDTDALKSYFTIKDISEDDNRYIPEKYIQKKSTGPSPSNVTIFFDENISYVNIYDEIPPSGTLLNKVEKSNTTIQYNKGIYIYPLASISNSDEYKLEKTYGRTLLVFDTHTFNFKTIKKQVRTSVSRESGGTLNKFDGKRPNINASIVDDNNNKVSAQLGSQLSGGGTALLISPTTLGYVKIKLETGNDTNLTNDDRYAVKLVIYSGFGHISDIIYEGRSIINNIQTEEYKVGNDNEIRYVINERLPMSGSKNGNDLYNIGSEMTIYITNSSKSEFELKLEVRESN